MADNLGEVTIPYGADDFAVLRCTLGASKKINTSFGGFIEAYNRLARLDQDAFVAVVAAGLGKEKADVEQAVYQAGVQKLAGPVTQFLQCLSNGGRPPVAPGEQDAAPTGEG